MEEKNRSEQEVDMSVKTLQFDDQAFPKVFVAVNAFAPEYARRVTTNCKPRNSVASFLEKNLPLATHLLTGEVTPADVKQLEGMLGKAQALLKAAS